jgi:hypothetical protein
MNFASLGKLRATSDDAMHNSGTASNRTHRITVHALPLLWKEKLLMIFSQTSLQDSPQGQIDAKSSKQVRTTDLFPLSHNASPFLAEVACNTQPYTFQVWTVGSFHENHDVGGYAAVMVSRGPLGGLVRLWFEGVDLCT